MTKTEKMSVYYIKMIKIRFAVYGASKYTASELFYLTNSITLGKYSWSLEECIKKVNEKQKGLNSYTNKR